MAPQDSTLPEPTKACSRCKIVKALSEFKTNRARPMGHSWCRVCDRERGARYRAAHPEETRAAQARWRAGHPEYAALYREEHPGYWTQRAALHRETVRAQNRERSARWLVRHPDYMREYERRYRREHPEQSRDKDQRRKARLRGARQSERVSRAAIIARDRGICHICKKRVAKRDMTLDHLIPLAHGGPHTAANLAVAHKSCNSRRGAGRLPAQLRLLG